MNPATLFLILRDAQRVLRLREIEGQTSDAQKEARSRVIEGMAALASYVPSCAQY